MSDSTSNKDILSPGVAEEVLKLCETAYEVEASKKEEMEKKAQYYLALITGFLGIWIFKGDILNLGDRTNISVILATRGPLPAVFFSLLIVSLISSLFCIMMVLAPRRYDRPYPSHLVTFLIRSSLQPKTEPELILERATEFALAAEENMEKNLAKSKWLSWLSKSVFATLVMLTLLLVVSAL